MLVLQGEDANLLSVGAVDFGIIVDSAVILVENIFRNLAGHAGRSQAQMIEAAARGHVRDRPLHAAAAASPGPSACG